MYCGVHTYVNEKDKFLIYFFFRGCHLHTSSHPLCIVQPHKLLTPTPCHTLPPSLLTPHLLPLPPHPFPVGSLVILKREGQRNNGRVKRSTAPPITLLTPKVHVYTCTFTCTLYIYMETCILWNLSLPDILGTEKVVIFSDRCPDLGSVQPNKSCLLCYPYFRVS